MKQYLKMADYFVGGVSARLNGCGDVVVDYDCADPDMIVKKTMLAIEHAINSHDELVQMNQELLAKLAEIDGCFEAALVDGWIDAVADEDVSLINDIYCRRIDYARHIAISALTGGSV